MWGVQKYNTHRVTGMNLYRTSNDLKLLAGMIQNRRNLQLIPQVYFVRGKATCMKNIARKTNGMLLFHRYTSRIYIIKKNKKNQETKSCNKDPGNQRNIKQNHSSKKTREKEKRRPKCHNHINLDFPLWVPSYPCPWVSLNCPPEEVEERRQCHFRIDLDHQADDFGYSFLQRTPHYSLFGRGMKISFLLSKDRVPRPARIPRLTDDQGQTHPHPNQEHPGQCEKPAFALA